MTMYGMAPMSHTGWVLPAAVTRRCAKTPERHAF
jgi:hypothetical protein